MEAELDADDIFCVKVRSLGAFEYDSIGIWTHVRSPRPSTELIRMCWGSGIYIRSSRYGSWI